jgi:FdrA protein
LSGGTVNHIVEVHRGRYYDSVRLMQVSRDVLAVPGVTEALVAMATELNFELLDGMGFAPDEVGSCGPNDLLIAIAAIDDETLQTARGTAAAALAASATAPGGSGGVVTPRRVETAAIDANVALVSVPGANAYVEATAALRRGLHVMVFSNNVALDQEIALKREARDRGLLVMGPDCGTAIVSGLGLGFANVVRPGPVGVVGASGTGIQQLCCLLDDAGFGIRHALGTGSRDLSEAVGGISTLQALEALDRDPGVEVIVVVSKPPDPEVAAKVRDAAAAASKPAVVAFLGDGGATLEDAAADVVRILGETPQPASVWRAPAELAALRPYVVGLFSGGTLCAEAESIVTGAGVAGRFVDLGADEFTSGRPHPMIDQRLRLEHIAAAIADPETGVLLIDVVLGFGSHPDPAAELEPLISAAFDSGIPTVVSLCGTVGDPQDRARQAAVLHGAGASVWLSNAAAAGHAVDLVAEVPR